ncbi:GNAT family N-acetyltransferase [Phytohabitans rumicis]|uniref:GCN5-like N-acetyltransferase n=1 Tax=Phytohabitans rumicis TaxID=1076125 RepID=A0A6V8L8A9_9ACTN|nr:GNAT family N-acetyltransferase [Phytohabitans rumicis]GFJ91051.1 GCN5-like N-acetyltransferase [Phytohabitans rumicis]
MTQPAAPGSSPGRPLRTGVPTLRAATYEDLDQITEVMVTACLDTPDAVWLIADRDERETVYRRYSAAMFPAILADDATYVDVADIDAEVCAVAVWDDYADHVLSDAQAEARWRALVNSVSGPYADRIVLLDDITVAHQPRTKHFCLSGIGVRPDRQGYGLGTRLLRYRHHELDAMNLPSYVVATTRAARHLFAREGYQDRDPSPFFLPDAGPAMWPMVRDGRARRASRPPHPTTPHTPLSIPRGTRFAGRCRARHRRR